MKPEKDDIQGLLLWDTPVYVRIGSGLRETIGGPEEALSYLLTRWPAERGGCYERAMIECKRTLEQYGSPARAREAFIAAADEGRILA
ncbi:DUF982 domain-containing protein [Rhizobium sp. BR 315]|uniref:DUF982 domain-containing protein n=1 Tax=Rhizobium sp. BR 315 TaxID=3040014 RepID=UPI003D33A0F6